MPNSVNLFQPGYIISIEVSFKPEDISGDNPMSGALLEVFLLKNEEYVAVLNSEDGFSKVDGPYLVS